MSGILEMSVLPGSQGTVKTTEPNGGREDSSPVLPQMRVELFGTEFVEAFFGNETASDVEAEVAL